MSAHTWNGKPLAELDAGEVVEALARLSGYRFARREIRRRLVLALERLAR